jgi:hypothetical protein
MDSDANPEDDEVIHIPTSSYSVSSVNHLALLASTSAT